jgi:hypothetical protein
LHPPFSLFLPEGKEKTGRARSKREKEVWSPPAMPEGSYFGLLFLFSLIQFPEMPVQQPAQVSRRRAPGFACHAGEAFVFLLRDDDANSLFDFLVSH